MRTKTRDDMYIKEGLKVKVHQDEFMVRVRIQPPGFWSDDIISVRKEKVNRWDPEQGPDSADIGWGSGGTNGTLTDAQVAKAMAIGLRLAAKIAKNLDKLYGSNKREES